MTKDKIRGMMKTFNLYLLFFMNLSASSKIIVVLILVIVLIGIGGVIIFQNYKLQARNDVSLDSAKTDAVPFILAKNLDAATPFMKKYFSNSDWVGSKYHSIELRDMYSTTVDGKEITIGKLRKIYGNGVPEEKYETLFVFDSIAYIAQSNSDNFYPLNETGWVNVSRASSYRDLMPLEREYETLVKIASTPYNDNDGEYNSSYSQAKDERNEEYIFTRKTLGIQSIAVTYSKKGIPETLEIKDRDNSIHSGTPFKAQPSVILTTIPAHANSLDRRTADAQNRKKPGIVSGTRTHYLEYGVRISYPAYIDNTKVVVGPAPEDGEIIYSFHKENDPNYTDYIQINCSSYPSIQAGPKSQDLFPIVLASRKFVKDWGFSLEAFQDSFSFSTENAQCFVNTTGSFRMDMISIGLTP